MEESLDVMPRPKLFSTGASAVYKQTSPVDINNYSSVCMQYFNNFSNNYCLL